MCVLTFHITHYILKISLCATNDYILLCNKCIDLQAQEELVKEQLRYPKLS